MTARPDLAAIIPAAGRSSRMGAFKPLLPFGPHTVIEQVISAVREAGIGTIRVVVGWDGHRLIPMLERRGVPWVENERYPGGMYTSIQAGVRTLPYDVRAFFMLPADMPRVRAETLIRLIAEWERQPAGILYPCHEGRRGHPPLIDRSYVPEILSEVSPGGLRSFLARHAEAARDIEVADPGILVDLDTPEEYRNSLREDPPS